MVEVNTALSKLSSKKILVAGDLILDTYTVGSASRISPEAPIPVITVYDEHALPGGAGNVMLNLKALGAEVVCLGRVGNDSAGVKIKELLEKDAINTEGLIFDNGYKTPVKNRIVANAQQIVRVDHETVSEIRELVEEQLIGQLDFLLSGVKLVAISDYGKGLFTETFLQALIEKTKKKNIFVIADPKGCDFKKYRGVDILKPNEKEAYIATGLDTRASLEKAAEKIHHDVETNTLMVTRSENGITLFPKNGKRKDFSVEKREVKDVTGAGDTVLAILALCFASGLSVEEAVWFSNTAAGLAVERFGCARVTFRDLTKRLLEEKPRNKLFDLEHHFVLFKSLENSSFSLLILEEDQEFSSKLYNSVKHIKNLTNNDLLIYLHGDNPNAELIDILCSLGEVSFILAGFKSLNELLTKCLPKVSYRFKGGKIEEVTKLDKLLVEK